VSLFKGIYEGGNGGKEKELIDSIIPSNNHIFKANKLLQIIYSVFHVTEIHHFLYTVTYLIRGNL
jgi:hypothetical protein